MKTLLLGALLALSALNIATGRGKIVFEGPVPSQVLETNRTVRIYLPPSYRSHPDRRYPVLYVHDGQNAFTTVGTNVAFGWGNWELDRIAGELAAAGRMREILVVAVDCGAERYLDYRGPAYRYTEAELAILERKPPAPGDDSRYERYRRFLIEELKPRIDREYRTRPEAANTGALGSSMGGVCGLALAWDRPDVFGKAASLSGAFQVERTNFLARVLRPYRGQPKPVRLYLDSGVCDFMGGDDGRATTDAVAAELSRIGWREGVDLHHFTDDKPLDESALEIAGLRRDRWAEAQKSQHNEFYWRQRVWRALVFLFPPS